MHNAKMEATKNWPIPRSFEDPYKYMSKHIRTKVPQEFKNKKLNDNFVSQLRQSKLRWLSDSLAASSKRTGSQGVTTEGYSYRIAPTQPTGKAFRTGAKVTPLKHPSSKPMTP